MAANTTAGDLEKALFARARRLGEEYLARAGQTREHMIEEENERLRIREERETLAAEAEAERHFRRRVQATELRLEGDLDRRRWELMEKIHEALHEEFGHFVDSEEYHPWLRKLLARCASIIGGDGPLVAVLNERDRRRLAGQWPELIGDLGRPILLAEASIDTRGGVLVHSEDDSVRVDNSFEGRLERLEEALNEAIAEELFTAAGIPQGALA